MPVWIRRLNPWRRQIRRFIPTNPPVTMKVIPIIGDDF